MGRHTAQNRGPRLAGVTQYRTSFDTPEQALAEALFLELMAPGESEAQACAMLAEEIAAGLDEHTVELCKAAALERYEAKAEDL